MIIATNRRRAAAERRKGEFVHQGFYGAELKLLEYTTEHTLTTGGTTSDISGFIPAGAIVMSVTGVVLTTITTGGDRTTVQIGTAADADLYALKAALTAGTVISQNAIGAAVAVTRYGAATDLRLTVSGGSSGNITAGKVRLTMWYYLVAGPTS